MEQPSRRVFDKMYVSILREFSFLDANEVLPEKDEEIIPLL